MLSLDVESRSVVIAGRGQRLQAYMKRLILGLAVMLLVLNPDHAQLFKALLCHAAELQDHLTLQNHLRPDLTTNKHHLEHGIHHQQTKTQFVAAAARQMPMALQRQAGASTTML